MSPLDDGKPTLAIPTVHLNGTSRDRLIEQLVDAAHPLRDAIDKLGAAAPNQRDYYPQPTKVWKLAQVQHESRLARLRSVLDELQELALQIQES